MAADRPLNVLFLCMGNSARSQMAEAIMNRDGQGRFAAFSAGVAPRGEINPHTIDLLKKLNFVTDGLRSKSWTEFSHATNPEAPELDFVFTVCDDAAGEACPVWPGAPMSAHWGVPDPAKAEGADAEVALAYADAFRMLNNRIAIFMNLPLESLDALALRKHLEDIGAPAPAAQLR